MASNITRMTKIQLADAIYEEVMKRTEELNELEKNIIATSELADQYDAGIHESVKLMKDSKDLSSAQKQMISEVEESYVAIDKLKELQANKEKIQKNIDTYNKSIEEALVTYIEDTEKEIKNIYAQKQKYSEFISKEKEKCEALRHEMEELISLNNPEDKDIIEAKKQELADKEKAVAGYEDKLKSYDDNVIKLNEEFNQYKEKYKEIWDNANARVAVENPQTDELEEKREKAEEEKAPKQKEEDKQGEKTVKKEGKGHIENGGGFVAPAAPEKNEKDKETDIEAYNRISTLLLNKNTCNQVEQKDIDRIIKVLSNSSNYSKIPTQKPFFGILGKSKAEKVFAQLGKRVSLKVTKFMGDSCSKETKLQIREELTNWDGLVNINSDSPVTLAEEELLQIEATVPDERYEEFKSVYGQLKDYRNAVNALSAVRIRRKDYKKGLYNALPQARDAKTSPVKDRNASLDMGNLLNSDEELSSYLDTKGKQRNVINNENRVK